MNSSKYVQHNTSHQIWHGGQWAMIVLSFFHRAVWRVFCQSLFQENSLSGFFLISIVMIIITSLSPKLGLLWAICYLSVSICPFKSINENKYPKKYSCHTSICALVGCPLKAGKGFFPVAVYTCYSTVACKLLLDWPIVNWINIVQMAESWQRITRRCESISKDHKG